MPRSALNVSFDTTHREEIIDSTPESEYTPRSPWSYFRFQTESNGTTDELRSTRRKSREIARHTPRSARSKTSSPRRRKRPNSRGSQSKNSRAKSSSPPPSSRQRFDPTVNRHLWTMWRIAITSEIVTDIFSHCEDDVSTKNVRRLKNLAKRIYISNQTRQAAYSMMNSGVRPDNAILTRDFLFFGIPRVILNRRTDRLHDTNNVVSY